MPRKSVSRIAADLSVNIVATVLVALAVAIGGTVMTYLGSAWAKPLLVGGSFGLITLLILLAIRAMTLMPKASEPTTLENIEDRVRDWLHNFHLGVKNSPIPAAHFNFVVTTDGGKTVFIARAREQWTNYLQLNAYIGPNEQEKKAIEAFTEEEINLAIVDTKLELNRLRMGYSGLGSLTDGYSLQKKVPITASLSEDVVIGAVWEVEAALNCIYFQAVKNAHGFRKRREAEEKLNENGIPGRSRSVEEV